MLKYKKEILLLLLGMIITFSSCKKELKKEQKNETIQNIENIEFDFENFNNEAVFEGDILKDEKIAKKYADIIFESILEKPLNEYKVFNIAFDSEKEIWVINYRINDEIIGGDISIVLSKTTGEVIRIYFGE